MATKIEWTEKTWNPFVGCTKVSAGCKNCYAERHSYRLATMPTTRELYGDVVSKKVGGEPRFTGVVKFAGEKTLLKPLSWRKPSMVFVNSMSDLFHESIPFYEIDKVFAVMTACPQHTFQILTKRPARMKEYFESITDTFDRLGNALVHSGVIFHPEKNIDYFQENQDKPYQPLPNVWLGVSVEDQATANERIPYLLETPAAVRFLSCEPLLGEVELSEFLWEENVAQIDTGFEIIQEPCFDKTNKIGWVIVGGESGKNSRPMHPDWARSLRDQCVNAGVAFFFKQWGDYKALQGYDSDTLEHKGDIYVANQGTADRIMAAYTRAKIRDLIICSPNGSYMDILGTHNGQMQFPAIELHRVGKSAAGRLLDGREWNELPTVADSPQLKY